MLGGEQDFRTGDGFIGLHQLTQHGGDPVHEAVRDNFSALDLFQTVFPFCGKLWGLELFGQHGDKRRAGGCGKKVYHLLGFFALHKTRGHQLFNDTGTGCRGSDALALRIVGHILFARAFHR